MSLGGGADKSTKAAQKLSEQQFQWQKDQATQATADAATKRASLATGLDSINSQFGKFDDSYYKGLQDKYNAYATPQIDLSQTSSREGLRSSLANHGKLNSSTAASQYADLGNTYQGIYKDAQSKSLDYANTQRGVVNQAKQNTIGQMYASESPEAGLQAASGNVAALSTGPAYEPISALLGQAAKFASMDYNNSLYRNQSTGNYGGLMFNAGANQSNQNSNSGNSTSVIK